MRERRILVVDDEPTVRELVRRGLGGPLTRVSAASDGTEAIDIAVAEPPDLILLDVRMPGRNGRDVLKDLRRNPRTRMVPVILLTGDARLEDKVAGFASGADDYITKPFEIEELRARVDGLLRRNQRDLSANPLTRLPGSPSIEAEVNRRLLTGRPFAFLYVDIDNFKPFNDAYGYAMGDLVIQETAALLAEAIVARDANEDFLGHVGGDDFVVVTEPSAAEDLARRIATDFDRRAPAYYSGADRARGRLVATDRQGKERYFPLISLSIAVVTDEHRALNHYAKVVDIAAEIKRYLKGLPDRAGSAFLKDRRKDGERL